MIFKLALIALTTVSAFSARATEVDDLKASTHFHDLLREVMGPAATTSADLLHATLPSDLSKSLMQSRTIGEAMKAAQGSTLETLFMQPCRVIETPKRPIAEVLKAHPTTIVIVPGIFSEFIKTRAFPEVFAKPSSFSASFAKLEDAALKRKSKSSFDLTFDNATMKQIPMALAKLLTVGSIDDQAGNPLVKVVLFNTPTLSLESVAAIDAQGEIFARRLEKYLALTGPQKIALVGYSRGLESALSMVSTAQKTNRPWLKNVRAVVSYNGVIFGSTLADAMSDSKTVVAQGVTALKELRASLKVPHPTEGASLEQIADNVKILASNQAAWLKFAAAAASLVPKLNDTSSDANTPNSDELEGAPSLIDPSQVLQMALSAYKQMGLDQPLKDYATNVVRFQSFVDANILAVVQLQSADRLKWWQTHTVPTSGISYYAISSAMADPAVSNFEKSVFYGSLSYDQSYDDKVLLQSHRDYTKASGVSLNDSQVSVPQSMFLPEVIAGLNPAQKPMRIRNLGVFSSHHWGLTLDTVSPMKDKRLNPVPRTAILTALAGEIGE